MTNQHIIVELGRGPAASPSSPIDTLAGHLLKLGYERVGTGTLLGEIEVAVFRSVADGFIAVTPLTPQGETLTPGRLGLVELVSSDSSETLRLAAVLTHLDDHLTSVNNQNHFKELYGGIPIEMDEIGLTLTMVELQRQNDLIREMSSGMPYDCVNLAAQLRRLAVGRDAPFVISKELGLLIREGERLLARDFSSADLLSVTGAIGVREDDTSARSITLRQGRRDILALLLSDSDPGEVRESVREVIHDVAKCLEIEVLHEMDAAIKLLEWSWANRRTALLTNWSLGLTEAELQILGITGEMTGKRIQVEDHRTFGDGIHDVGIHIRRSDDFIEAIPNAVIAPPPRPKATAELNATDVVQIGVSCWVRITERRMIPHFVEAPLVEAVELLFDRGIETGQTSANMRHADGMALLEIKAERLSRENQIIAESLGGCVVWYGADERISFSFAMTSDLSYDSIREWALKIAEAFQEEPPPASMTLDEAEIWLAGESSEKGDTTIEDLIMNNLFPYRLFDLKRQEFFLNASYRERFLEARGDLEFL